MPDGWEWEQGAPETRAVVNSVLQGFNIPNLAGLVFDEMITNQVLDETLKAADTQLENAYGQLKNIPTTPDHYTITALRNAFLWNFKNHLRELRRQIGLSRVSASAANLAAQLENIVFSAYGHGTLFNAVWGFPLTYAINTTASRYWRKYFHLGRPGLRDAFIMWRKGLVDKNFVLSVLQEDLGFSQTLAEKTIDHLFFDPGTFDLFRIVRNVPVSDEWIVKKLRNYGVSDEDLPYFVMAIKKEGLKDEMSRAWSIFENLYAWGIWSEDDARRLLSAWGFSQEEINLRVANAKILREKTILQLRRDREIYLYRKGVLDETQTFQRLQSLGLDRAVANAIVSLEAAKKGIEWEAG